VAKKKKIDALAEQETRLVEVVRRLAAHAEVIGVAVRSPGAVPPDDLDDAIAGLHDLHARLDGRGD
jgi:hypothetical protein